MATDNDLSGLLGELRAGGQHDSHGQFTLDRAQARAKMQKFQLVDARRYVLELVQAALLRGAIDLRFDIDADDLRMRFDGESFRAEELGELWASIFTDGDEPLLRGLRQLALGLNAALGLNPRRITVRSGGHQLVLRPDADEVLTALEPGALVAGTTIHVEQRLRLGIIVDFLRNITGRLAEEQYLREGCLHCQMPVLLDGVGLPGGLTVAGAIAEHEFVTIEMSGVIALVPGEAPATLRLIKDGVWIDTLPLEGCGPGIVAVLEGERLRKDVSLAKIVADEALAQAIARVRGERWGLMARLVEAARRGGPKAEPTLARVRAEVLQFLRPRDLRERPDVALVVETLRWPDARTGGRELRSVSLAELAAQAGDGEVPGMLAYARQEYPELVSEGPPILRIDAEIAVQLGRILACAPVVCDVELAQRSARVVARKAWLRRPMPARLPDDRRYLVRAPIAAAGLRGELGVGVQAGDEAPQAEGTLWLLREGCLLLRVELAWGVPALDVVLEGSFEPGELYDDVLRDQALVAAALQVIAGLQVPLAALVEGSRDGALAPAIRGLVKAWLLLVLDAQAREQLWEALKVPGALRPELAAVQAVLPSPALLRAGGGALDVLLQMPLFEDLDGAPRSLDELARRQAQVGRLDEVDRAVAPEPSLGRDVAWLGRGDRKILAGLLGGEQALRSWVPSLAVRRRERKFWSAPPQTIAELAAKMHAELQAAGLDPALWSRTLRVGPVEAVIMLAHGSVPPGVEPRLAQIELRFQGRPLETRSLDLGLWPLVGAATSTALQPTPEWDEAGDEAAVEAIVAALREAAWALLAGLLAHHGEALARWRWVAVPLLQRLAAPDGELFAARWPGLTALPLLHTLDGGAMSIDAVDAVLREHGHIEWVPPTTPTIDLGAPPVLRETAQVMTAMRLRFGAKSVVDGEERLRRRGRDEQLAGLPAVARAELDASLVWARVSLASGQPGIAGEIGLARERGAGGLSLVLCTRGRQVGVFTESDVPAPTVAILADEALPIDAQGKVDQRSKRYGQHLRRCRKAVPGLIVGLCARFGSLDAEARASARALLLGYATAMLRRVAAGGVTTDRGLDAVRGLPLFVDVQGRAHALAELEPGGSVDAVGPEAAAPEPGLELEQTVLRVDAAAASCLAAVLRVRRLDERWDDELAALRELARAPRFELPDLRRVAWVEREATIAGGLQAQLWIARAPAEAEAQVFTRAGREVGRLAVLAALPCSGVVSGKGLTIGGEGVELDRRQRGSLAKQICALYETLAKTLRAGRLPLDQRERALARLVEVDAALTAAGDPLLAELGKPLEQLRAALAGLISPAMRRERAPMRAAEPTARAGLGASPGAAAGISPSAASGAERSTSGAEISAESAEISAAGAEISAEGAEISPSAPSGAEISPSAAPPRSAASRAAPSVSGGSAAVSRPARAAGAPMPAAAALTPEQGLLAALRAELAWARERHGTLLDALGLDRLTVGDTRVGGLVAFERGIVVQRWHPLVVRMLERLAAGGAVDPIELSFVVSSAYTLMNEIAEEIDAEDERAFVARLAESLAHGLGVRM